MAGGGVETLTGGRVAAVVVTYNRPAELRLVVAALLGQSRLPDTIIIFDNGGPQAAAEVLHEQKARVEIIRSQENLGGAGGFAAGLDHAIGRGADWVWLMDDDAVPEPDALAALLAALPGLPARSGALCCAVREDEALAPQHRRRFGSWLGNERTVSLAQYRGGPERIDIGSFVGFLVSALAVREIGLPDSKFFLAYDDTEYSLRMGAAGWLLWLVPDSVIHHLRPASARLRTSEFGPKHYFNIRNRIVVTSRYAKFPAIATGISIGFAFLLWLLCRGLAHPSSVRILKRAIADGIHRRLGSFPVD